MSETNRALLRRGLDYFNDTGTLALDLFTADVVFRTRGALADSETFHGQDGFEQAVRGFMGVWRSIRFDVVEIVGSNPLVAVLRIHMQGRESGVEVDAEESWAVWFRETKMSRIEQYGTKQEAVNASGLAE